MKAKLLRFLDVLGERYTVKFHKEYVANNGVMYAGLCDCAEKHIDVSLKEEPVATLIHELVHAVIHEAALNQCQISKDAKEIICEQVSRVLVKNFILVPRKK